jgi:hypothetical protein
MKGKITNISAYSEANASNYWNSIGIDCGNKGVEVTGLTYQEAISHYVGEEVDVEIKYKESK